METIFVGVCLLLPPGALILGERSDFVFSVIMWSTTDFCVIPAIFLAVLLLWNGFHVPTKKQFVEYKMISSSGRQIQEKTDKNIIWMEQTQFPDFLFFFFFLLNGTWNLRTVLVGLQMRNGYDFVYLCYSVNEEMPSTVITFKGYYSSLTCYWVRCLKFKSNQIFASSIHSSAFPCVLKWCPDEHNHEGSRGESIMLLCNASLS